MHSTICVPQAIICSEYFRPLAKIVANLGKDFVQNYLEHYLCFEEHSLLRVVIKKFEKIPFHSWSLHFYRATWIHKWIKSRGCPGLQLLILGNSFWLFLPLCNWYSSLSDCMGQCFCHRHFGLSIFRVPVQVWIQVQYFSSSTVVSTSFWYYVLFMQFLYFDMTMNICFHVPIKYIFFFM